MILIIFATQLGVLPLLQKLQPLLNLTLAWIPVPPPEDDDVQPNDS